MENESSTERKIFGKLHMLSEVSICDEVPNLDSVALGLVLT